MQQQSLNQLDGQIWRFEDAGNGYYFIRNNVTDYYLTSPVSSTVDIRVELNTKFSGSYLQQQRWKFTKIANRVYEIQAQNREGTSVVLAVGYGLSIVDGIDIEQRDRNTANNNAKWYVSDYWNNDSNFAYVWNDTVLSVYTENMETPNTSYFPSGLAGEREKWGDELGISFTTTTLEAAADIKAYAGSRDEMEDKAEDLFGSPFDSGNVLGWNRAPRSTALIGSLIVVPAGSLPAVHYVYQYTNASIFIISQSDAGYITKTILHEFGHAMGYVGPINAQGHIQHAGNIMYQGLFHLSEPSINDISFLQSIYDRFR